MTYLNTINAESTAGLEAVANDANWFKTAYHTAQLLPCGFYDESKPDGPHHLLVPTSPLGLLTPTSAARVSDREFLYGALLLGPLRHFATHQPVAVAAQPEWLTAWMRDKTDDAFVEARRRRGLWTLYKTFCAEDTGDTYTTDEAKRWAQARALRVVKGWAANGPRCRTAMTLDDKRLLDADIPGQLSKLSADVVAARRWYLAQSAAATKSVLLRALAELLWPNRKGLAVRITIYDLLQSALEAHPGTPEDEMLSALAVGAGPGLESRFMLALLEQHKDRLQSVSLDAWEDRAKQAGFATTWSSREFRIHLRYGELRADNIPNCSSASVCISPDTICDASGSFLPFSRAAENIQRIHANLDPNDADALEAELANEDIPDEAKASFREFFTSEFDPGLITIERVDMACSYDKVGGGKIPFAEVEFTSTATEYTAFRFEAGEDPDECMKEIAVSRLYEAYSDFAKGCWLRSRGLLGRDEELKGHCSHDPAKELSSALLEDYVNWCQEAIDVDGWAHEVCSYDGIGWATTISGIPWAYWKR